MDKKFPKGAGKNPAFVKLHRNIPTEDLKVAELLSSEALNNRFADATSKYTDYFYQQVIKQPSWWEVWTKQAREDHIKKLMQQKKISRAKALKIVRDVEKAQKAEYDSPLKVAERKIAKLENELARIREFIADPDAYDDRHSDP